MKVLIVDDDPAIHSAFSRPLRQGGADIFVAFSAEEARKRAREHPDIHGVLLDGSLASKDTLDTLPLLRELKELLSSDAVFVAASSNAEHNAKLVAAGCRIAAPSKPEAPRTLLQLLFPSSTTGR